MKIFKKVTFKNISINKHIFYQWNLKLDGNTFPKYKILEQYFLLKIKAKNYFYLSHCEKYRQKEFAWLFFLK